jgi:hypothetical protein
MKKIFTILTALFLSVAANAQDVMGICGQFTGWGANPDVVMTSNDSVQWDASSVVITETGGLKFRLNSDWGPNWGTSTGTGFPSGTAELNAANNIIAEVGTYDVSFNTSTHIARVENSSFTKTFENVTTIKDNGRFYEMFQKQSSGTSAPVLRVPIESTIIYFIHE